MMYVIHAVIFAGIAFMGNMGNRLSVSKGSMILKMVLDIVMSLNVDYMILSQLIV